MAPAARSCTVAVAACASTEELLGVRPLLAGAKTATSMCGAFGLETAAVKGARFSVDTPRVCRRLRSGTGAALPSLPLQTQRPGPTFR
jgi:hypothetical protein